jgi:hypothetical protein
MGRPDGGDPRWFCSPGPQPPGIGSAGAAQDLRPGVLCAGCGHIEIPRNRSDPRTHRCYLETLRYVRPIFSGTGA